MNYYIHDGELYSQDELQHYGVIGMKWGIRKGNYSTAFNKAVKKAKKYEKKHDKKARKAAKYADKLSNPRTYKRYKKQLRYNRRFYKFTTKAAKIEKKGDKWVKQMEKAFAEVKVSEIDREVLANGRRFVYMLEPDAK